MKTLDTSSNGIMHTKAHGGSIEVRSTLGKGTTFIVKLPSSIYRNEKPIYGLALCTPDSNYPFLCFLDSMNADNLSFGSPEAKTSANP